MSKNLVDLTGKKFGKLTVLSRSANDTRGRAKWLCLCDCGGEKIAASYSLQKGVVTSCGCVRSAAMKKAAAKRFCDCAFSLNRHLYRGWYSMVKRCHEKSDKQYPLYGAKGVFVCDEWRTFEGFAAWAKDKPDGTTLDRIDPNGPYMPENCRWADHITQQNNRRKHVWVEYHGTTDRHTTCQKTRHTPLADICRD